MALVRPELDRVNRELGDDLSSDQADLRPLLAHVGRYRGKQLRPALALLAGRAVGEVGDAHIVVAKVVELIHTATLVHDDILDGAELRRQIETIHALAGTEIAVLLGDYIYARAFHMACSLADPVCARHLSEITRVICQGEITQLLHRWDFDWTEERYNQVIADKTASLFGASARLGGHYAGATPAQEAALETYGIELGIAFQIADDCLDLQGDEAVVGKSLGTDLTKGKLTLPLLYLLSTHEDAERRLRQIMAADGGLGRLAAEFDVPAAVQFSLERARERIAAALEALEGLPEGPARAAMADLAGHVVQREL